MRMDRARWCVRRLDVRSAMAAHAHGDRVVTATFAGGYSGAELALTIMPILYYLKVVRSRGIRGQRLRAPHPDVEPNCADLPRTPSRSPLGGARPGMRQSHHSATSCADTPEERPTACAGYDSVRFMPDPGSDVCNPQIGSCRAIWTASQALCRNVHPTGVTPRL